MQDIITAVGPRVMNEVTLSFQTKETPSVQQNKNNKKRKNIAIFRLNFSFCKGLHICNAYVWKGFWYVLFVWRRVSLARKPSWAIHSRSYQTSIFLPLKTHFYLLCLISNKGFSLISSFVFEGVVPNAALKGLYARSTCNTSKEKTFLNSFSTN